MSWPVRCDSWQGASNRPHKGTALLQPYTRHPHATQMNGLYKLAAQHGSGHIAAVARDRATAGSLPLPPTPTQTDPKATNVAKLYLSCIFAILQTTPQNPIRKT